MTTLTEADRKELILARHILENPGIAARITNFIGMPIEKGFDMLPKNWSDKIGVITKTALEKASDAALFTIKDIPGKDSSNVWHKLAVATSGGVGGFFGFTGLAIELPVSTTIILRSIADIARSQGETVTDIETKLACMEVLALGGESEEDDAAESGYYLTRGVLAKSLADAAKHIAQRGFVEEGAPVLVKFFANIATRYGVTVSNKVAAQAVPVIGAVGGAAVNTLFMDHFQDMARGHFIVRKLERKYGQEVIRELYEKNQGGE